MKALIISDSHGLRDELLVISERHMNNVDVMIHCGDSELELNGKELQDYKVVRGNCDFIGAFPEELVHNLGEYKLFATHGHLYGIKQSLQSLYYRSQEVGAKIVCFGHSHIMGAELINGVLFINPGSILLPRLRKEKTYAILEIIENQASVTFYTINGEIFLTTRYEIGA
ncbi:metallophosphoesterase [Bacillus sp. RG28]|uniref:Phosphoesterase n=1 Tax=Gottfriedia endophytica TaxID=2820819 RepID=A0A940SIK9_9BACI|nr:metallophosphoesterase [Gottfriedia endophytica]MBP0723919.1 metallophosphoesterase [Gottfriedia endophytica]